MRNAMLDGLQYYVSADHVVEKYKLTDAPVHVSKDEGTGKYYAIIPGLGCGKNYATAAMAISMMLQEHGYTAIRVYALEV